MTEESNGAPAENPKRRLIIKRKTLTGAPASPAFPAPEPRPEREQSSIQFPYGDLESAISVARAILAGGGVPLTRDQLAGQMKQAVNSGSFLTKVATSRIFGLVSFAGSKFELTENGFNILDTDEKRQKSARADAFLSVPLYKRTYDEFKGKQLPPRPHGLEQAFVRFGVSSKQKTNARYAFDKSAAQAGFFPNGPDRLIEPIIGAASQGERPRITLEDVAAAGSDNNYFPPLPVSSGLHPFIQGLLDTLPEPQTNWAIEGRAKWLQAAANIFDLIYKGSGDIQITAKAEQKPGGNDA